MSLPTQNTIVNLAEQSDRHSSSPMCCNSDSKLSQKLPHVRIMLAFATVGALTLVLALGTPVLSITSFQIENCMEVSGMLVQRVGI